MGWAGRGSRTASRDTRMEHAHGLRDWGKGLLRCSTSLWLLRAALGSESFFQATLRLGQRNTTSAAFVQARAQAEPEACPMGNLQRLALLFCGRDASGFHRVTCCNLQWPPSPERVPRVCGLVWGSCALIGFTLVAAAGCQRITLLRLEDNQRGDNLMRGQPRGEADVVGGRQAGIDHQAVGRPWDALSREPGRAAFPTGAA